MIKEHIGTIGNIATVQLGGLLIHVRILDIKTSYGRIRWQIEPISGDISKPIWVQELQTPTNITNYQNDTLYVPTV